MREKTMPSDDADRQSSRLTLIRIPDQLQQAKRPDVPAPGDTVDQQRRPREASIQDAGILGQLETERAHD